MTEPAKQRHPIPPPHIAACFITKNSTATLERAIGSIRPWVEEIVVYDTGSTDGTIALLKKLNEQKWLYVDGDGTTHAQMPEADDEEHQAIPLAPITITKAGKELEPYLDADNGNLLTDFSFARQQSFEHVSDKTDWLLWLDDDDEIIGAQNLKPMAYSAAPEIDGFVFKYDYAQDERGQSVCELWRERLVRRSSNLHWKGSVHEVLVPPESKGPNFVVVPPSQVLYVHHRPADRYDPSRNLRILEAEERRCMANGKEVDPRSLAYLGTENMAKGQFAEAVPYLHRYLDHPESGWSDERMQVAHKLATCLRMLGNPMAAVECEFQALKERGDWAETYVGLAESFAMLGQWNRVEKFSKDALELGQPQSMLILNPLEFSFLPAVRVAESYAATGRFDEADQWLAKAAAFAPGHPVIAEKQAHFGQARQEGETIQAILKLREYLVRHDENAKAWNVVNSAPYYVAEHPLIVKARSEQKEMVRHMLEPDEYKRWYRDEPKESTYPWEEIDLVPERFERVQGLLDGLAEQEKELGRKPRVLDLGCNDWALVGAVLWRHGYVCDGVELNQGSYENALKLVEAEGANKNGNGPTIVQGDLHDAQWLLSEWAKGKGKMALNEDGSIPLPRYDAVSIFEVLEHVPDVEKALAVAESMLRPGGRVYLSTPNGAYERGNLSAWQRVERKGHLRATPVHELVETVSARGQLKDLRLHVDPNDPRLTFLSYEPGPRKGKVIFYAGGGWEQWEPSDIQKRGLGGSETALAIVATRLAFDGYQVKVYSSANAGVSAGALWRPFDSWDPTEECDLLVVSRVVHAFDNPIGAKKTALWCHDHSYPGLLTEERAAKIDEFIVLSEWQKDRFARLYPFTADKLRIIRNGIVLLEPETRKDQYARYRRKGFAKRKPKVVYSSSADRGLDVLLAFWPEIRERVPDAELHVFYGWDVFDSVARMNPALLEYKRKVFALSDAAGNDQGGVHFRGRIGQLDLAKEMGSARVWGYPTAFLETSCIGAMEARAAGLAIVSSELAALAETVGSHGQLIPWPIDEDEPFNASPAYRKAFIDIVVTLLTDEESWTKWHDRAARGVAELDWSKRTPEWEALVEKEPETVEARELIEVA